ncbi:MAG: hypothetical protein KGN39_01085 [Betaproteobacteria bacterium]|nr:hypothetical protein [Betaproteobacteria bacterium]
MPHLLVSISGHGFGHIAQTGPVLNALRQHLPDLRLTVVSTAPEFKLRQRIDGDFALQPRAWDFGFVMEDAFRIDREASAQAYREFHANWEERVAREADWIAAQQPDLLLANAAYLPLAAAARLGLPAVGMSSLNWADLFRFVFGDADWAKPIHGQMLDSYNSAQAFLKLEPGMAMPDLANGRWIGPVARLGREQGAELRQMLGVSGDTRLVLAALGGIPSRVPVQDWPLTPTVHWLVPAAWQAERPDMTAFEPLGWDFTDLLASVDALVGKPGYGTFAETACNGTPMLYARREDWPEQDALIPWLQQYGCCREVDEALFQTGALAAPLATLWEQARPTPPKPEGADAVAQLLAAALA